MEFPPSIEAVHTNPTKECRKIGPNTYRTDEGDFADTVSVAVLDETVVIVNVLTADQLPEVRRDAGTQTATVST